MRISQLELFFNFVQVSQVFSTTVSDATLCGGKFCDPKGTSFAVAAYDSTEITIYTQKLC